jgi:membrane-bound ClpP family serine protease
VTEWFDGLSGIEQFLFSTGVFSTLIFAIQFFLTLFGLTGDDGDVDGDIDDGEFSLGDIFTLRNGVSFLMGFSWGGLMAYEWGLEHVLLVAIVGFMIGTAFVAVNMVLLVGMSRLRHDGSIQLENAVNQEATVTLPIPERRTGVGKVMVPIQGRLKEYHAVTDGEALTRNTVVTVLEITGSQLVVAE